MSNMLSACLSLLKRKFSAIGEENDYAKTDNNSTPRKKLRVQTQDSIRETTSTRSTLAASDSAPEEEEHSPGQDAADEETVEELEAMVNELEERNDRDKKKAEQIAAKRKKVEEQDMECMICRDIIQNPQLLPCGHSACYGCLRKWWTKQPTRDEDADIIDTEAESDVHEEGIVIEGPDPAAENAGANPEPRPRRRHRFPSAVDRKKLCPYCNEKVTCRPGPDFNLLDIVETLCKGLTLLASRIQARSMRRSDLWHGIFHPENEPQNPTPATGFEHQVGPPPSPHPDPILNHFAQAQNQRRLEEVVARRERERAQAYEEGRTRGILETQLQWDRVERARQARLDRALQGRALAQPDPVPVRQAALIGEVGDGAENENPQDPASVNDPAAL